MSEKVSHWLGNERKENRGVTLLAVSRCTFNRYVSYLYPGFIFTSDITGSDRHSLVDKILNRSRLVKLKRQSNETQFIEASNCQGTDKGATIYLGSCNLLLSLLSSLSF